MHRRQFAPPGVTPNYVNPETTSDQVTITGLTLIIFSALFLVARWSVKLRVVKKQSWDDYWITFAWLLFIADMLYLISIMSTKIAILLIYKALFGVKRSFRYLCYGMMAIVTSYCVIFFFIFAFHCNPVQKAWHIITYQGPSKCFGIGTIQIVIGGFNIVTDFIILIMPMPIILGLNMGWKRKIGLLLIFATGIVVLASTIVRQVIVVQHLHEIVGGPNTRNLDASWNTAPETLWLTVENDIGIICACLPSLAPLRTTRFFSKTVPGFVSYLRSKSSYPFTRDGSSGNARTKGPFKGVLGHHASAESGVELVKNAAKNGKYISANDGGGGLTHEKGSIKRETDMQASYWSRPDALV
ncbi:MAG: hypothetical protein L6R35_007169 [Caloplaca aegaea]|nr:MAG: hypothetical protein L6R35_007169 [Caloplaca aegaea]